MLTIYKLFGLFFYPFFIVIIYLRKFFKKEDNARFKEKLFPSKFFIDRDKTKKLVWFHAASIGETQSIIPLIKKITISDNNVDILITTVTTTSANLIKEKFYNYKNVKNVPDFPKEYVCILRQTFGEITNRGDFWYELNRHEDSQSLIVKNDFEKILIPYFENLKSELKILEVLETEDAPPHIKNLDWERLHFYLKFNNKVKAKETYHKMLKETFFLTARNRIIEDYKEYDFLSNR